MAEIKTNAIVVGRTDYREKDRMLTLFSPNLGRLDVLARQAKSQKSPLLAASEYFCSGEYVLYNRGEHTSIVSCHISDAFYPIREDYDRFTEGMYFLELCRNVIQPEQENERLFLFLLRSLAYLAYSQADPGSISAVFTTGFISLTGYRPQVRRCARCGCELNLEGKGQRDLAGAFSPEAGGVVCEDCMRDGEIRLSWGDIADLQKIMRRGLDALSEDMHVTNAVRTGLRQMAEDVIDGKITSARMNRH